MRGQKVKSIWLASSLLLVSLVFLGCTVQPENLGPKATQDGTALAANAFSANDYADALKKTIQFFDANKCGPNVALDNVFSWRGACHTTDGSDVGTDLTGGYHDAGDHVKFNMPAAYAASMLGWAYYEFEDSFNKINYSGKLLSTLKYFTDYFLKCHPDANTYYYQVGDGGQDHSYWGAPEAQTGARPTKFKADLSKATSDVSGQTAGALALAYLVFKSSDATYAAKCLKAAKEIYNIAINMQGRSQQESYYQTYSFYDDLAWASIWLSIAENNSSYLTNIKEWVSVKIGNNESKLQNIWTLCWDDVYEAVFVKMSELTGDQFYKDAAEWNLKYWTGQITPPNGIVKSTPRGLRWLNNWGSLRYAAGATFAATLYYKQNRDASLKSFATSQVDYILGANPYNWSYIIGFGSNWPKRPHHRAASGRDYNGAQNSQNEAIYTLTGALIGGPDANDNYRDETMAYEYSEVALDYNASILGTLAGLLSEAVISSSSQTSVSSSSIRSTTSVSSTSSVSSQNDGTTGTAYPYGLPGVWDNENGYMQAQYLEWKGQYVTASGAGGFLRVQRDAGTQFDTVSEGIGYGMLLAVYYNDRTTFDGLFKYSKKYRNANNMMLWQIDQYGNVIGSGGATDADEDIAVSLCFASKVWGSSGAINYGQEATTLINSLMNTCVEPGTFVLKPGDSWGGTSTYNPSYFAPSFYRIFKAHTGDVRWDNVIATGYAILDKIQAYNAGTGFSPDWCTASGQNSGKSYELGYDAIRVPFRIGMDWSWNGNTQARDVNKKFIAFFDSKGSTNTLRDGYTLTGTATGQWWSPTFASMIASAAMSTTDIAVARKWYDISKNKQDPYTNPYHYFGSCLRMLNLTYMTGNLQDLYNGGQVISSASYSSVSSASSISSKSSVSSSSSSSSSSANYTYTDVPAKIEAEDYDAMSGIQTENCGEGTLNVGWIDSGDWLDYGIRVNSAGSYIIDLRTASTAGSGSIDILIDNNKVASFAVPNSGGWQTWTTISGKFNLSAGNHVLRVFASGSPWNLNWIALTQDGAVSSSKSSQASSSTSTMSGVVEAENYTAMSGVQTEACSEGGLNVGWIDVGDWMEYENYQFVNMTYGAYEASFRVAAQSTSGSFDFYVKNDSGNYDKKASLSVPNTGGWQTWTSIKVVFNGTFANYMSSANRDIKIVATGGGFNINKFGIVQLGDASSRPSSSSSSVKSSSSSSVASSSSTSATGAIKVQMFNGSTAVQNNTLSPRIKLINNGSSSVNLADVKIRYYFNADGSSSQNFWCDYAAGTINGSYTTLTTAVTGTFANGYCDIGFTSAAGILSANSSAEIQVRITKSDWSNFDQSNDFSFNSTSTSYVDWAKTPAYINGTLQWGVQP